MTRRRPGHLLVAVLFAVTGCGAESTREEPPSQRAAQSAPSPTQLPDPELPNSQECARSTVPGTEARPQNTVANGTVPPTGYPVPPWPQEGYAPQFNERIVPRIDGQFTGTTDQILAWGACRWGMPADVVRAMAIEESSWDQAHAGDISDDPAGCVGGDTAPCPTSFGILQLKARYRPGSWPQSVQSTAFNVDYGLAAIRGCYEGWVVYLQHGYQAGDLWGCLGWHFSGEWRDPLALGYIERVREHLRAKPWTQW